MDEVLRTASSLLMLCAGVGGAGAILLSLRRRPRRAWVPAIAACSVLLMFAGTTLGVFGVPAEIVELIGTVWFLAFPVLAATFPDGRVVPRWAIWYVVASFAAVAVDLAWGRAWNDGPWWPPFAAVQQTVGIALLLYRYRRSAGTGERESLRWVLLGLIVTVAAFMAIQVTDGTIGGDGPAAAAKATLAGVPFVLGLVVGTVKPRAWNVDAAFHAVLVVLLAGWSLFGVFVGVRALAAAAGADAVAAASWGAVGVAALTYPIVRLAARGATWLVYRERIAPSEAVARLAANLDADDPRPVAQRVADVAASSVASPAVRLVASAAPDAAVFDAFAGDGEWVASAAEEFPVVLRGELLATLGALPRRGESELSRRDRDTLRALARHAAPALDGDRALREAQATRAQVIGAREEERRRLRRELHDDLGPALSGLALSAAAVAKRADGVDAPLAESARELQHDIGDVVTRAREISHGLRPAILDDLGLESAIRERLGGVEDVRFAVEVDGRLPAAVDLAALRIVQEAVTNARRHARATSTTVRIALVDAELRIDVVDDGVGVPRTVTPGLGLRSIRERAAELGGHARVTRRAGGGTAVSVRLPVPLAGASLALPRSEGES